MLNVVLNKNEEKEKLEGFPWVFSNEINRFDGEIVNGKVVKVLSSEGSFVGYGFLNTSSKIMVRFLSLDEKDKIDKDFFRKRIAYAIEHRKNINYDNSSNCYRMVFSEADHLPGLIVDKYADYLSVQFLCLGMDMIKQDIIDILVELLAPKGIYERSDSPVRLKEGLLEFKGKIYGDFNPRVEVLENNIRFIVDMENGQKTGYFLDQKLNRDMVKFYVKDKEVLDCFSNVGGFALHSAHYGAKHVDALDISKKACDDILYNASLNGFTNIDAICCDAFDYLRNTEKRYDVVILDPPAFTKDKDTVKKAYRGYKEINLSALKLVKEGGYLLTFSCSQHMTLDLFMQMVKEAANDTGREVQMIDLKIQGIDHPSRIESIEQLYLKCIVLRVK